MAPVQRTAWRRRQRKRQLEHPAAIGSCSLARWTSAMSGRAYEVVYDGCCTQEIDMTFRLSNLRIR
jgi:hypothetical protein